MCGKKIVSAALSVCLTSLLTLSSNLEARAAVADVSRIPLFSDSELEEETLTPEDLAQMAEDAANEVSGIPNREIEPMSQDLIEYALVHADEQPDVMEEIDESEVSPQIAMEVAEGVIALIILLASAGSSALTTSGGPASFAYKNLSTYASSDSWSKQFTYALNNQLKAVTVTADMAKALLAKLDSAKNGTTYHVDLTTEDKEVLAYALYNGSVDAYISNISLDSINIQALDGYEYYYVLAGAFKAVPNSVYVAYTKNPIDFNKYVYYSATGGSLLNFLYSYSTVVADSSWPYLEQPYCIATYNLSSVTGLYEYSGSREYDSKTVYTTWAAASFASLMSWPFPTAFSSSSDFNTFKTYFPVVSPLLLDGSTLTGRVVTVDSLFKFNSVAYTGDVSEVLNSKKNILGQTSALNPGAGYIIGDTATDKPGTGEGTDTGTGSGSATVDISGITAELKSIKDIVTTMQDNVANMATSINSVVAELQEIKAAIKDLALAGGGTIDIDISDITDAIESLQADVSDVRSIITTINKTVAEEKEIITSIDKQLASYEKIITDIRADIAAIPSAISDILTATGVIADTVTDTGAAVGSKIDALPGSITDSLSQAAAADLSQAQTSKDWALSMPLQNKFPFSIPWDIAACITLLKADPIEPIWKIPFVVKSDYIDIDESIVIDLSGKDWQILVKIVRVFTLLMFIFALAMATRALIKG